MPDVVIENPTINSPFEEPTRHFYFDQDGITDKITEARRISAYFVPIPPSKKKSGNAQLVLWLDLVPEEMRQDLDKAKILITNYHAFQLREKDDASSNTKELLGAKRSGAFKETPDDMVRRVCRGFTKRKGGLLVINDEAHHCYRPRVRETLIQEKLSGDARKEAEESNKRASLWISGLEAVKRKLGVQAVYDLSATPFFLNGSGYTANELFPWVVSDFSLIDAIESGIVKIPRVPVSDNNMVGALPTYRDLWLRIRDELPKKG